MAPIIAVALDTIIAAANATTNNTASQNLGNERAKNAFSDPFTIGIQVVQTVALGILLVLACITLFHCRERSRTSDAMQAKRMSDKFAELCDMLSDTKARITEVGDAVEKRSREGGGGSLMSASSTSDLCEKRSSGLSIWESDVMKRLRGI